MAWEMKLENWEGEKSSRCSRNTNGKWRATMWFNGKQGMSKEKKRSPWTQKCLEWQTNSRIFWMPASASPSPWLSHSISLSDSPSLMPGEPFKLYSVLPQSSECMSHMPHSHDITGPGTARGTSHSQALLCYIAHCTRGCGSRRERVNFLSQAKAKSQSSPQSTS